jgi:opacity protein-like surface antigen
MTIQRALLVLVSTLALGAGAVATSPVRAGADEPPDEPVEFEPLPAETERPPAQQEPEQEQDFTRDGWYVQAQGIYALENFGAKGGYGTGGVDMNGTGGFNIEAGYRVAQLFAFGAEFEWIYSFESAKVSVGEGPSFDTGDLLRIGLQNVGIPFRLYPLARLFDPGSMANRFQPFIKLSPTWQWADREELRQEKEGKGSFVGRMGGGLDVYLTENFVLVASALYNWPAPPIDSLGYASFGFGLQYRFGGGGSRY